MSKTDKGYAWVIPFACCFIQAVLFGMYRSYSLMYKVLLDTFKISRSDASWPFSLCMTVIHLTGPVSGSLNKYVSTRVITFTGCLFASVGVGLGFFAKSSILMITIGVGIIQGFGIGLTYVQNNAIINQYFERYRGLASGISLSGGTIGAFILSFLLEYSLGQLPLQTSFLILASISLTTLPVALLLSPFRRNDEPKKSPTSLESLSTVSSLGKLYGVLQSNQRLTHSRHSLLTSNLTNTVTLRSYNTLEAPPLFITEKGYKDDELKRKSQHELPIFITTVDKTEKPCDNKKSHPFNVTCKCLTFHEKCNLHHETCDPDRTSINSSDDVPDDDEKTVNIIKGILCHRLFHLISLTHMAYFWASITYTMVIVDFALDKGIPMSASVGIMNAFSIGDLFGRLGSGILLDRRILSLKTATMISIFGLGFLLLANLFFNSFTCFLVISSLLGFLSGVINILLNLLFCHYISSERAALSFGLSSFMSGVATLARPLVVGFFRDSPQNGSYDGLLVFLGIVCIATGCLWFFEPSLLRKQHEPKTASVMTLTTSASSVATTS